MEEVSGDLRELSRKARGSISSLCTGKESLEVLMGWGRMNAPQRKYVNMSKMMVFALGATALSSPVYAQSAVSTTNAGGSGVEEIIVTAQKREQNLQDVPIAISALSPAYLEKREITSISNLSGLAPNLKVDTAGANRTSSIA